MKTVFKLSLVAVLLACNVHSQAQAKKNDEKTTPIELGTSHQFFSKELNEKRTLNIYLPPGYKAGDTTHYPVIYLLDGSLDEDFIHIVGLVQFNTFEWIARVPECIVVGIANTDRKRDMTFPTTIPGDKKKWPTTGGSAKFITCIEQEIIPYVEQHFRTNSSRTLIGESLGGLFATQVLFTKPQLFSKYIIISPSLWWNNGTLLKQTPATITGKTTVYVGVGKEGLAPTDEPHVMEVDANVLADKLHSLNNKNLTVYFDYLPEETHATIDHQAVLNAFKRIYRN